jgi:hypothetical protein
MSDGWGDQVLRGDRVVVTEGVPAGDARPGDAGAVLIFAGQGDTHTASVRLGPQGRTVTVPIRWLALDPDVLCQGDQVSAADGRRGVVVPTYVTPAQGPQGQERLFSVLVYWRTPASIPAGVRFEWFPADTDEIQLEERAGRFADYHPEGDEEATCPWGCGVTGRVVDGFEDGYDRWVCTVCTVHWHMAL